MNTIHEFIGGNRELVESDAPEYSGTSSIKSKEVLDLEAIGLPQEEYQKILTSPEFQSQSCNTVIAGTINTGKTHLASLYANALSCYQLPDGKMIQNRPIIVVNHTKNKDYRAIPILPMQHLGDKLNPQELSIVQVCPDTNEGLDSVIRLIHSKVKNSVIIFDDCACMFYGNLPENHRELIKSSKRNGNDIIFQFHAFAEIPPMLLLNSSVVIVKQTMESKIKEQVPNAHFIKILLEEVRNENKSRPVNQKYATRMLDFMNSKVAILQGNSDWGVFDADTYFNNQDRNGMLQHQINVATEFIKMMDKNIPEDAEVIQYCQTQIAACQLKLTEQ